VTPLYPQKLALTSPTGGGRSVGIVRVRTKATEFSYICLCVYPSYCNDVGQLCKSHKHKLTCRKIWNTHTRNVTPSHTRKHKHNTHTHTCSYKLSGRYALIFFSSEVYKSNFKAETTTMLPSVAQRVSTTVQMKSGSHGKWNKDKCLG